MKMEKSKTLEFRGFMKGHNGWVTCMQVGEEIDGNQKKEFLITGSRDFSIIIWDLTDNYDTDS